MQEVGSSELIKESRESAEREQDDEDWAVWGRWFFADISTRTISPFSKVTVPEWIERRFGEVNAQALAELEQFAISAGDAGLLERVSQARPAVESAEEGKGLAEYRQANFAEAIEWTRKALRQSGNDYARDTQAYSVLAMALHRLNMAGEAREALRKATELADTKLPKLDSGDLGPSWHDWIIAQTLLREAKALLGVDAKTGDETKMIGP